MTTTNSSTEAGSDAAAETARYQEMKLRDRYVGPVEEMTDEDRADFTSKLVDARRADAEAANPPEHPLTKFKRVWTEASGNSGTESLKGR